MYFEIDESHPDITPVGSVMSWREGVLLSLVVHLVFVIIGMKAPAFFIDPDVVRAREEAALKARQTAGEDAVRLRAAANRHEGEDAA